MPPRDTLCPYDLIAHESRFEDVLSPVLAFSSLSLYFPAHSAETAPPNGYGFPEAGVVQDQDLLFIPLIHAGRRLGMLRLTGVPCEQARALAPVLPQLITSCLHSLHLEIRLHRDPLTGVLREESFLREMAASIERMASQLQPGLDTIENPGERPDFAVLVFDVAHMGVFNRQAGHAFGDQILQTVADALQSAGPAQSLIARIQGDSFAVLLPGVGPQSIAQHGHSLLHAVHSLTLEHPVTEARVTLNMSAGGVCFPHHQDGRCLQTAALEQSRRLVGMARDCQKRALRLGSPTLFTPWDVLHRGGRITEILSRYKVRIDLGSIHQARLGHHFQLLSTRHDSFQAPGSLPPGTEIRLIQVSETSSLAEIVQPPVAEQDIHIHARVRLIEDPVSLPELRGKTSDTDATEEAPRQWTVSEVNAFFRLWAKRRQKDERFTMCMIGAPAPFMAGILDGLQALNSRLPEGSLCTRYSSNTVLLYIPGHTADQSAGLLSALLSDLPESQRLETAVGIAPYPCLDANRGELLSLAAHALEHAQYLPKPGLACFDSITVTLQGDRAFARKDLQQSMHHYSQALLLDPANSLARNSLAICLARVGEHSRACSEFRRILEQEPDNYMAHYNYGYVCLKLQDRVEARACFHRCLELTPGHSYSLLRLGQMAEEDGDLEQAEAYCRQAAAAAPDQGAPFRALGRMAWKDGNNERARQYLHQALVAAPEDPDALRLLARLTMEQGDDPEVAESLIRKSLRLQPDHPESIQLLAAVLHAGEERG